jgi:CubicO group peptidase (beta-lactamase class C family)/uncharacterized protein (DUF302 family)
LPALAGIAQLSSDSCDADRFLEKAVRSTSATSHPTYEGFKMNSGVKSILLCGLGTAMFSASLTSPAASEPNFGPIGYRGDPKLSSQGKYIDQRVAEFMKEHDLPGLSMAIVQAPYIPRSAGYGRLSFSHDELASTKTMWNIGPITQAFTGVAIFQLYEAHKLNLDDPVGKYVKDLPPSWQPITLLQLLQHSSGIPDYRGSAGYNSKSHYRGPDVVALVKTEPLQFAAGTEVRQSATNFALLGLVIEQSSHMSYHDFINRYQIEAVHLGSTMFAEDFTTKSRSDRHSQVPGHNQHSLFKTDARYISPVEPATGHIGKGADMIPVEPEESSNLFAFGDIWSSAEDISAWDIALAGGVLIKSADNRAILYGPAKLSNGHVIPAMSGWEFTHHPGFMDIKGNSPGFSSYLSRFTAESELVCVTLLSNKEGVDLAGLARDIADSYRGGLGSGVDSDDIITRESVFNVQETSSRLADGLKNKGIPVFATFDHAANATAVGLDLRPTQVLVFGNPKVGTQLMLDSQSSALDLPLKVLIWEDDRGRVWTGYRNMKQFDSEYHLKDQKTSKGIGNLLDEVVRKAASVY